jgi:urea transport system ATP-binding protein
MQSQVLVVESLKVCYGQSEVIPSLSLSARDNEIVAVMGRNGMGKTTLFKALMGVLPPRAGTIVLSGKDITGKEPYERVAEGIAYVPQGRMIFPTLTVEENIKTGLRGSEQRIPEHIYGYFPVLREMRGRRGGNLSGGQQQQLAIARALAANPRVLLLDEPTEGIQPSIIKELAQILKRIRDQQGLVILVSEQVLSFALEIADRLLVLDRGRLVQESQRGAVDTATMSRMLSI